MKVEVGRGVKAQSQRCIGGCLARKKGSLLIIINAQISTTCAHFKSYMESTG